MVSGRHKSRSMRRVFRRTPGSKTTMQYKKRAPKIAKCSCGKPLNAVPRKRPYRMHTMPKTEKRPERPYGGVLCSSCMRKKIIERARK